MFIQKRPLEHQVLILPACGKLKGRYRRILQEDKRVSNRWQANKIGLVNFWYYDEQEFPFAKGRMLLRGSNGSGKSVTMQSVVPLLLDGNVNPERLDPFGTRDRKMSNYLLEEEDGRDERTGYLYLEFHKSENERYLTIGMGLRARRGNLLINGILQSTMVVVSGRIFSYIKKREKRVFDRQVDYMAYVNQEIFGFETVDEYKEMITGSGAEKNRRLEDLPIQVENEWKEAFYKWNEDNTELKLTGSFEED